ncbi:MAG: hypothetical protein ABSE69_13550, partial [Roseiarcus sp.]
VVLGLQRRPPDRTIRIAVELADLLHLELLGLFLEDKSLRDLASRPFAREFRPLDGSWRPIDIVRISQDIELAARSAERMFAEATRRLRTRSEFEAVRGPTAETIASVSRSSDIVMIVEPTSPVERATQQFLWLVEAAFRSAAAVMLVPTRVARTTGPIAAVAAAPDDPSIHAAAAIAIAAKEELIVLETYGRDSDDTRIGELATDTGLTVRRVPAVEQKLSDPAALPQLRERLVVMARGVFEDDAALMIAATRRVPVLVVEPPQAVDANVVARQPTGP